MNRDDTMQLLNDGTLKVKVANVLDIKRVMVMDDNVIYNSYYPDRPKGEWIGYKNFNGELKTYECSNCKHPQGYKTPYCCECGADMRGDVM